MKGAFLIAAREIAERRAVFVAALVAGVIPFAAPLFPGVRAGQAADARDGLALLFVVAFGAGMALVVGGTIVGRDLSEGRLGFDFARPLGVGSIWAGRLGGAVVLILLVLLVVVLPTTLVGGGLRSTSLPQIRDYVLPALAAVLLLVPLSHVASIAFRSRSGWLGVDLAALLVLILVGTLAGRRLADAFALGDLIAGVVALGGLLFLALWCATFAQLAAGRTDLRRGHRIQSAVLWGTLLTGVTCFDLYSRFVVTAGPEDIVSASAMPAPRGDWLLAVGNARGRGDFAPTFLLDGATGRSLALGGADPWVQSPVVFSGDGKSAVWLQPSGLRDPRRDLRRIDLTRPEEGFRETRLSFLSPFVQLALSEDGERVAVLEGSSIAVHRSVDGALLASGKCVAPGEPAPERAWLPRPIVFFADSDHVRVVLARARVEIYELDVVARSLARTGQGPDGLEFTWMVYDSGGQRLLLRDAHDRKESAVMLDGRSGGVLARFPKTAQQERRSFRFLEDGSLVFAELQEGSASIRAILPSGEERQYPLPGVGMVTIGGEISPGKVTFEARPRASNADASGHVLVLDLGGGQVHELASGRLSPWLALPWVRGGRTPAPGSLATRLFQSGGAVLVLDPASGAQRVLVGRKDEPS